jgi:adenosylmethionine-8-amino-7-oxononanoate aminotransferase
VERRVRASGALLIADEVMTGFGRSGSLFACQRAQIQPDLMALSKGLTGGFMPMGVTMASERLYEAFIGLDPKLTFFHGHSFTANPLGCAAALASLELLKQQPQCYGQFEQRHRQHLPQLTGHPRLEHFRSMGSIAAFDLIVDQPGYLQSLGRQLQRQCLAKGVYLRPLGHVVYLLPPLGISEAHLEQCYSAILQSLAEL